MTAIALLFGGGHLASMPTTISLLDAAFMSGIAESRLILGSNGGYSAAEVIGNTVTSGQWMLGGVGSDYQARATIIAGALSTGYVNTWQGLGADLTYAKTKGGPGTSVGSVDFTLEIRDLVTQTVLDTVAVCLVAEFDSGA